ncbi:deoxynucleotidyltransferase terminal-interacting protein 2 [Genypterus blacodes]|uniref:deoxynucleotidyltransferase terminal-interacting protein 2 n=1 Tax=Genypterus blacodes TaxID=154954 RepID=UPI003F764F99
MVATRRGVRLSYPNKTNEDASSAVPATPSTGRRTRSTKPAESSAQQASVEETSSQPETEPGPAASSPIRVRCTRASRLHSPELPCSHAGSVHEADVSDEDSCCSGVSEPAVTRTRGRRKPASSTKQEDGEISEVESCSSAVSASKTDWSIRRSARRKKSSDPAPEEEDDEAVVVIESSSSAVSQSQRKSQRKCARMRSLGKQQTEDSELSDAASCTSSVSGVEVSGSAVRRSTRPRRLTQALLYLDEVSSGSRSPAPAGRQSRAARGKAAAANEAQSCESDGFESGPSMTPRRRTRAMDSDSDLTDTPMGSPCSARGRGTPCSSRTGSGSSSRAAGLSRLKAKTLRVVLEKSISGAQRVETGEVDSQAGAVAESLSEQGGALNDSRLESTVMADPECTLLEEDETFILVESDEEGGVDTDLTPGEASAVDSGVIEVGYGGSVSISATADVEMCEATTAKPTDSAPLPSASDAPHKEEAVSEAVVSASDQQEERSAENKDGSTSEMELNQETQPPSEPSGPSELPSPQSPKETVCEQAVTPEVTEEEKEKEEEPKEEGEGIEVIEVDDQPSVEDEPPAPPQEEGEDIEVIEVEDHSSPEDEPLGGDVVKMPPGGEEEMEVSTSGGDAQQVVESSETPASLSDTSEAPGETIQVTNQEKSVTVEPEPETQPEDSAVIQGRGVISLLESSEDEEEDESAEEEGRESSGEEEEERVKPQEKNEEAGTSVGGLFMIDTRPGQDADQQYYKDGTERDAKGEQEEQDEEFVDEEGDDEEDEDTQLLFYSRNSQLKELSSRIDPGIRVKELGGLYINFDGKSKSVSRQQKEKKIQDEVMKKSVVGPDFEKKDAVPPYSESKQALKMKRREERGKSTGSGWFDMKAPELTQELKGDLHVLKMRSALDSKRFYKKNDRDGFPKYFQVGTVVDNPADFYHSRVPKKNRKRTMVEELLADAEFRQTNKKKFQHIVSEKAAHGAGRRNKKNRFHKK